MKKFTFSDMNRLSGDILDTALAEPVSLTKHGKEKLVILSVEQYQRLASRPHAVAYTLDNMPDDIRQELQQGLDAILADPNA